MKAAAISLACAAVVGCVDRQFTVGERQAVNITYQDCDEHGRTVSRHAKEWHVVVTDRVSGCVVGALEQLNPQHKLNGPHMRIAYVRLWTWECPAGAKPPPDHGRGSFEFMEVRDVPVSCNPDTPLPAERNPLLHLPTEPAPRR
jgi:hypothetical protein